MKSNPIRAAVDLIDAEPAAEFLGALRAHLVAENLGARVSTIARQSDPPPELEEYVMVTPSLKGPSHRAGKALLAAAACVALLAAVVVIKRSSDSESDALRDVDPREASPLGENAMITAEQIAPVGSVGWARVDDFSAADYAREAAAINNANPACAELASVGLAQPTSKSVIVHQDFANGPVPMLHDVWVFATSADASRAMDVIAGDVFPTCSIELFDRLTLLNRNVTAVSTSTLWRDAPAVAPHGDRQVVFGQKIQYKFPVGSASAGAINAYVQVGRAIAFIDPQHLGDLGPDSNVERAIAASTAALERVFGQ
jgi:hypothetical protein